MNHTYLVFAFKEKINKEECKKSACEVFITCVLRCLYYLIMENLRTRCLSLAFHDVCIILLLWEIKGYRTTTYFC